jgi:hypothetical protein
MTSLASRVDAILGAPVTVTSFTAHACCHTRPAPRGDSTALVRMST